MKVTGLRKIDADRVSRVAAPPAVVRILEADLPADRADWLELWQGWPDRDVMAHPEYVRLFARPGDLAMAATLRTAAGAVLYPFLLRPLASEPWAPPDVRGYDLTSAYGYGGPFAWGADDADSRTFRSQVERWAQARGVASSFARLSLFPERLLPFPGEIRTAGPNIVLQLEGSAADLVARYDPKVRRNLRRAQARGCSLRVDPCGWHLDEFLEIYRATMERHHAASEYFFPRGFFESLIRGLRGQGLFFHAILDGRIVSTMLVLLSRKTAYYFLGGTLAEAFDARPSDYLMNEVIQWCRAAKLESLVLGGGNRASPGLLRFKKGFAPDGEVPFLLGTRIHDAPLAERLIEARRRWELARGTEWRPDPEFFPAYRAGPARPPNDVKEDEACPRS